MAQTKGNLLLTGASGFIGGHLAKILLQAGYTVYAPMRAGSLEKTADLQKHEEFHVLTGAFYDKQLLQSVDAPVDYILHTAAIRGGGRADEQIYRRVNAEGTRTLAQFALQRRVKGFLYLSTVGVLGTIPEDAPASENSVPKPDGFYHLSKWQGEEALRRTAGAPPYLILRPTITYGKGDDGFIPKMIRLIRRGKMALPRNPVMIHLLSVQALNTLIVNILQNNNFNGKTYIVADKKPVFLQDVAALIVRSGGEYFTVPKAVFRAADILLAVLGRQALRTSVQLISNDWTYDITASVQDLQYEAANTLTELKKLLEDYDRQND